MYDAEHLDKLAILLTAEQCVQRKATRRRQGCFAEDAYFRVFDLRGKETSAGYATDLDQVSSLRRRRRSQRVEPRCRTSRGGTADTPS